MINEVENKTKNLYAMSDLEFDKNSVEMMRYRVNRFPYILGLLGLVFSILAAFICLNSMMPTTIGVIIKILINIFILLAGFLTCEKVKSYSKRGSLFMFVLAGLCVGRIFYVPLYLIIYYPQLVEAAAKKADTSLSAEEIAMWSNKYSDLVSNYLPPVIVGSGCNAYLPSNGIFRAVIAIILLVAAAASFICSGIFGYQRSTKLAKYLESINATK